MHFFFFFFKQKTAYEIGLIRQGEVLLSGPSNYGLAETAIASCSSLQQATGALLMTKPNLQRIASLIALQTIIRETSAKFRDAEQQIAREDSGRHAIESESP